MKKLFAVLFVAAVMVVGAFAEDEFPTGTWVDANWNADWRFEANGVIQLRDKATSNVIHTFTKDTVTDYKLRATTEGLSISFYCKETERAYKFTKPLSLSSDLIMEIDPDWTTEDYKVNITLEK